jgi:hypothetical protein
LDLREKIQEQRQSKMGYCQAHTLSIAEDALMKISEIRVRPTWNFGNL